VLRACLAAAVEGRGGVALLTGEPGSGKSRLADEFATFAAACGVTVLRGGASEAAGMPPYLPFLEALGRYVREADANLLRTQVGPRAAILAGIFPELRERLGDVSSAYPLPPQQARLRLYESVGALLRAIAAARPLLLLLDDLHWADGSTLDLLCHVAVNLDNAPVLIVGAYRESELAQSAALERSILELTRRRLLTTIPVARLSAVEVADLVGASLGGHVDAAVTRRLYRQSEGNPFFAEELLRAWQESGTLRQDGGRWSLTAPEDETLPASIVGTIRRRLARLSPDVVEHLRAAAIVGRTFATALVAEVTDVDIELLEEGLRDAARARLIEPAGAGAFTFSHDTIRECLYADVTPSRRTRMHGVIGRALEARSATDNARRLADLAFHFARSADAERGVIYSRRAAEAAAAAFAAEDAAAHFRTALGLMDEADQQRAAVLLGLGDALLWAGAERDAAGAFAEARAAFLRFGATEAAARAAHGEGRAWVRLEEHGAARTAFEAGLALLGGRVCTGTVQILVDLANLLTVSMGRQSEGVAHSEQALALARTLGDRRLEAAALRTTGNLLARMNDVFQGIQLLEQARALAEECDDPVEAAECCGCLVPIYVWSGDVRRSEAINRLRIALAERCHDPYQLRHAASALAVVCSIQGRFAEADQQLTEARTVTERLASEEPLAFVRYIEARVARQRGEYARALESIHAALRTFRAMGPAALVWYLPLLGLIQHAVGDREGTIATMAEIETVIAANPAGSVASANALTGLGELVVRLGDRRRAADLYPELAVFRGLLAPSIVDRVLGQLATLLGDGAAARLHFDAADALARRQSLLPELGHLLAARAELALAEGGRGSASAARGLLKQALDVFDTLGMVGDVAQVRTRLRTLPTQPGARHPALPAGLSEREAEVLRLVAAGCSNREIARTLALSEKTIANYITGIYTKTDSENRAAAAAFAIRHGLA
jgi:DNA-binding CsgD family transcriptional regulator/tetratricopeptide (TPR) repeat protein